MEQDGTLLDYIKNKYTLENGKEITSFNLELYVSHTNYIRCESLCEEIRIESSEYCSTMEEVD